MHFKGSYVFEAPPQRVYRAILDPSILQASIPGCEAAWHADETHMKVRLLSPIPLPGLQGPYDITLRFPELQEPNRLLVKAERYGRVGGTISALTAIVIHEDSSGSQLDYDAQVDLQGPIAFIGSPIFQEVFKHALRTFFENVNASLTAVHA